MLSKLTELIRGMDRRSEGYSRALAAARVRASYQRAYFAPALFSLIPVKTDQIASMAVAVATKRGINRPSASDACAAALASERRSIVRVHSQM